MFREKIKIGDLVFLRFCASKFQGIYAPKCAPIYAPKQSEKQKKPTEKWTKMNKTNKNKAKKARKKPISVRNEHFLVDDQGLEPWAH